MKKRSTVFRSESRSSPRQPWAPRTTPTTPTPCTWSTFDTSPPHSFPGSFVDRWLFSCALCHQGESFLMIFLAYDGMGRGGMKRGMWSTRGEWVLYARLCGCYSVRTSHGMEFLPSRCLLYLTICVVWDIPGRVFGSWSSWLVANSLILTQFFSVRGLAQLTHALPHWSF